MGRTVVCQTSLVVLLLACSLFVACKSEGDDGGGSSGSAGAAGAGATKPPASCFSGPAQCNPLNNAPCNFDEACDVLTDEDGGTELVCFPPKNVRPIGGICLDQGPFCQSELHCKDERCVRLCCSTADCPDAGACTAFDSSKGTLGTCPLPPDGGT